ncbi:MAG: tig [Dehalococcoidia bacterium]|nr:tig [Dehalococcoidia bacterium]
MKVTVEQLPQRQVVLSIEAEPAEYEEGKHHAYQHIVANARVPGFRKGKAPMAMVERYTGKAAFLEETIQHLIPELTGKAIDDQKLEVVGSPNIEIVTTEPVVWKATVDLLPEVDLGSYKELRVPEEPVDATEDEIAASIEELRRNLAPWEPVLRPAQLGDLVTLDQVATEGGRVVGEDKDTQFEMVGGSNRPGPGFPEQLVGLSAGDSKEFDLVFPGEDSRREVAGKTVHFSVTIKDVKAKNLPTLDDEFAKSVGDDFDTFPQLRQRVQEQVVSAKQREARTALENRAVQALIDGASLAYSPGMVNHEAAHILEDQESELRQNRISMEEYLRTMSKTREDMLAGFKPIAEQRLKRSLVLVELRKKENLEVSDEEVGEEIDRMAAGVSDPQVIRRAFKSDAAQASIKGSLLTRKTLDRLIDIVTDGKATQVEARRE